MNNQVDFIDRCAYGMQASFSEGKTLVNTPSSTSCVHRYPYDFPSANLGFIDRHSKFIKELEKDIYMITFRPPFHDFVGRKIFPIEIEAVLQDMKKDGLITNNPDEDAKRLQILKNMQIRVIDSINTSKYYGCMFSTNQSQIQNEIEKAIASFQRKKIIWV